MKVEVLLKLVIKTKDLYCCVCCTYNIDCRGGVPQ